MKDLILEILKDIGYLVRSKHPLFVAVGLLLIFGLLVSVVGVGAFSYNRHAKETFETKVGHDLDMDNHEKNEILLLKSEISAAKNEILTEILNLESLHHRGGKQSKKQRTADEDASDINDLAMERFESGKVR